MVPRTEVAAFDLRKSLSANLEVAERTAHSRYPLVDSPWAHSAFGSGELTLRYGDAVHELWFNQ